jgi:hypothetical protein
LEERRGASILLEVSIVPLDAARNFIGTLRHAPSASFGDPMGCQYAKLPSVENKPACNDAVGKKLAQPDWGYKMVYLCKRPTASSSKRVV